MKPLQLRLQAFGSFPGLEVVDFSQLAARGMFVVSGNTGTGKTTIFDAMCWALYGDMPLKDSAGVRSDHAAAEVETFVEFTFECEGERYVVRRTAAYVRPALRGGGTTKELAKGQLDRLTDSGGTVSLETKPSRVGPRCAEIIGLDEGQFQRVVLLPQGEFSEFLLAGSGEREKLLGKLFGGEIFDAAVEELKAAAAALSDELRSADISIAESLNAARGHIGRVHEQLGHDIPEGLSEADRPTLGAHRDAVTGALDSLRLRAKDLVRQAAEAAEAHRKAKEGADRFDQFAAFTRRRLELAANADGVEAGLAASKLSAAARPVINADRAAVEARRASVAAVAALDERIGSLVSHFDELGVSVDTPSVTSFSSALDEQRARHAADAAALTALGDAEVKLRAATSEHADREAAVSDATAKRASAEARLAEIDRSLPQFRERAVDLGALTELITKSVQAIADRSNLDGLTAKALVASEAMTGAASAYAETFRRFIATEAPRLAADLIEGEPCPVCGSADHPNPATDSGAEPTTYDDVEAASANRKNADDQARDIALEIAGARATLGALVDRTLAELQAGLAESRAQLSTAETAHRKLDALQKERDATDQAIQALEVILAGLEATAGSAAAALEGAQSMRASAAGEAEGIDADRVAECGRIILDISELVVGLEDLFGAVKSASGEITGLEGRLAEALAVSGFDSVDAARAVVLDEEAERALVEAGQQHRDDVAGVNVRLGMLTEQGVPSDRPDLEAAEQAAARAAEAREQANSTVTTAGNAFDDAGAALAEHDLKGAKSSDLRVRRDNAQRAYEVCRSGGSLKVSLKRWVLGRELDRVTGAANIHLGRMTGDRYSLRRSATANDGRMVAGLDLEVLDSTTGRPRPTKSLSGGEQFQASLALALGLADVVSHGGNASGKRFEALFVDEGFGSLDPDALEQAIAALHQLHDTGRIVGAITHVEAMKQQLHVGIEVRRRPDGGGSTLVVHP